MIILVIVFQKGDLKSQYTGMGMRRELESLVMTIIPKDLFQKDRHQDGHKIKQGNDNDAQADFINQIMAKIPFLPLGRFDKMLKPSE